MTTGQPNESPKPPYRRKRTVTRSAGQKTSGDSSASGQSPSEVTAQVDERLARRKAIGKAISEALKKETEIDWMRRSAAITAAQEQLDEHVTLYCENKVSGLEVKQVFRAWVNAHRGDV